MFDTTARVWERAGDVIVAPPVPVRPFIDTLKTSCRTARYSSVGWVIPVGDADTAVALLRTHFPVVQDGRRIAPQPPPFVDGSCDDPFSRLDLITLLQSGEVDLPKTRRIIKRLLGPYAAKDFDTRVAEAEWRAARAGEE